MAKAEIKRLMKKFGTKEILENTCNDWGFGGTTGEKWEAVINGQTYAAYYKKHHHRHTPPTDDIGYYVGDTRFVGMSDWLSEKQFLTLLKASIEKREHFIIRLNKYDSNMGMSTQYPLDGDAEAFIEFADEQRLVWRNINEMDNTPTILSRKEAVDFLTKVIPMKHRHYAVFQSAP